MRQLTSRLALTLLLVGGLTACSLDDSAPARSTGASGGDGATGTEGVTASPETTSAVGDPVPEDQAGLDEALREAAWADDVERARELIEAGADVNAKDETEQSAYLVATSEGYLELLRLTLEHGAVVDDKDSWNGTGLIRAAERGHHLVVGELLQAGIDRDHVNRIGYQAIHEAVKLGENTQPYVDTLRVLVAGGVELEHPSGTEGMTALEMAEALGYDQLRTVLQNVLAEGADAEAAEDPDAALLAAAAEGDADRVALALRAGADLEARDGQERTALLLAATEDHLDVARLLVAMGASADAVDGRQDTPWLVTGVTGSVEMLEALLPAEPDLTITNRFGGVSVIPASERGHVDYVRRVVSTGIDVDHVNDLGWTALLEAVILGDGGPDHQEIVRILLDAGADPALADDGGVTPLQHARQRGYDEIAAILEPAGG